MRNCALWLRHAVACLGYHQQRAQLGIPEPPRLDPLCGAAALGACLRELKLPSSKQTVMASCRVSGEGSNISDLVAAADKLGAKAHIVAATDAGLMALPKPLIAYVEHDHFIAVAHADRAGVSYLCSDCGAWPGGRVHLSWRQWHALEATTYVCITSPGSAWDARMAHLPDSAPGPVRLASARLRGGALNFPLTGVWLLKSSAVLSCGQRNSSPHCPPNVCCLMDGHGGRGGAGGGGGAGGRGGAGGFGFGGEKPHMGVGSHGPSFGDPVNLSTGEEEYSPAPDLVVYNPHGPSVVWQRVYNSLHGTDQSPYEYDDFGIGWSQPYNVGVADPNLPTITSGTTNLKYVFFPNGARVSFTAPSVPTAAQPKVMCTVQAGGALVVEWDYDAASIYGHYVITQPDRSQWITRTAVKSTSTSNNHQTGVYIYQLATLIDHNGNGLAFTYGSTSTAPTGSGYPLLAHINDLNSTQLLLTLNRSTSSYTAGELTSAADCYNRSVAYRVSFYGSQYDPEVDQVSQVVATGTASPPLRYTYGYQNFTSTRSNNEMIALLHTITVPSPTGSGNSTATINYDSSLFMVTSLVDANNNTRSYSYGSGKTQVTVTDSLNNTAYRYSGGYDANMSGSTLTDGTNKALVSSEVYADPNDPYKPSSVSDGNVLYSVTSNHSATFVAGGSDVSVWPGWDIIDSRGNSVDHQFNTAPNAPGWQVSYSGSNITVTAPQNIPVGAHYEVRTQGSGSAFFDVVSQARAPVQYMWDVYGNLQQETSSRGTGTSYIWAYPNPINSPPQGAINPVLNVANAPVLGELRTVQEGNKTPTTFAYFEPSGNPQTVSTPAPDTNGTQQTVTTSFTYSALGNVLTVTKPGPNGNATTTFNYTVDGAFTQTEAVGKPLTVTDPNGFTTHYRYDLTNQTSLWMLRSVTDAIGNFTEISPNSSASGYNIAGQPIAVILPATGAQGAGRAYEYYEYLYPGGPLTRTTFYDESNTAIRQSLPGLGLEGETLSTTQRDPALGTTTVTSVAYDGMYRTKSLTDPNSHATSYAFNTAGYLASIAYPNANNTGFDKTLYPTYDANGNVLQRKDGRGIVTYYTYNDPESLVTNTFYPAGSTTGNVSAFHDVYGRTTEIDDGAGARTFSYDDLDETLAATTTYLVVPGTGGNVNPATLPSKAITYTHNPDGSEASMQTPGGLFSYAYFNNGWLSQITNPAGLITQTGYFANGWLAYEQTLKNASLVTSATSTYNPRGFLTTLANTGMGSSQFGGSGAQGDLAKMTYDGAADLTNMQSYIPAAGAQAGGSSYAYDYKSQLTGETTNRGHVANNSFVYDAAGNSTTLRGIASPAYNVDNQYTGSQFVYDGTGNPTTYSGHAATYDEESRLTTLLGDTHAYTADGMRSSKQIGTNARTYFLYAGDKPVCELDASGNVIATNTWGVSGLVARTTAARTVCYAFDPQGNVSQAIDPNAPAGSQILNTCSADAYGYRYASTGYTDPYMGFGGKWGYYTDAEVGTQLLGHRFYDSGTGRFINRDPIGYEGGVNQYGYTSNNPVNRADPSGFQWYTDYNDWNPYSWDYNFTRGDWHQYWTDVQDVAENEIKLGKLLGTGAGAGKGIAMGCARVGGKWVKPVAAIGGTIWTVGEIIDGLAEIGKYFTN